MVIAIVAGANEPVGTNPGNLAPYLGNIVAGRWKKALFPIYGTEKLPNELSVYC